MGRNDPTRAKAPELFDRAEIARRVKELGPWFHNLDLGGVATAPEHFLGDFPRSKWERFAEIVPIDLTGLSVLDIGCNAGFHAMEMRRRGAARVLGIDTDERYLAQARFAAQVLGADVEYRRLSVFELAELDERFDLVLFLGVYYHLRHPLLALDLIHAHAARDLLLFQTLQRGSRAVTGVGWNYDFEERRIFRQPGFPCMYFIEHRYGGDPTNWWIPNRAGTEAMLRSSGFESIREADEDVYLCRRQPLDLGHWDHRAVYPSRGKTLHRPQATEADSMESGETR